MIRLAKELAIAKNEGVVYDDCYNNVFGVFIFKVDGEQMQVHLTNEEYEAYNALVKIYRCRNERDLF